MIVIPELLSAAQAGEIAAALESGQFNDGNATTGNAGAGLKHNLELAADTTHKELGELVLGAVCVHDKFASTAFPAKYSFPMFSRYEADMYYNFHTDAAIMNMGGHNPVRTDLSCTIFSRTPTAMAAASLPWRDRKAAAK